MKKVQIFIANERYLLFLCLAISFLLRFCFMVHRGVIDFDGAYYAMLGTNLFSGNGYTEAEGIYQWYYPPLYPVQIGLVCLLINDSEISAELVSMFYGILLIIVMFYLGKKLYDRRIAIISTVLCILYVPYISFSSSATTEMPFIFLSVLGMLLAYKALNTGQLLWYFVCGVLLSLIYLTKPAGIQYLFSFFLVFAMIPFLRKKKWITIIRSLVVFLVGFMILSMPYIIFLRGHFGYWTPSGLVTRNMQRSILINQGKNKNQDYQLTEDGLHLKFITTKDHIGDRISLVDVMCDNPTEFIINVLKNFKKEALGLIRELPFHLLTIIFIVLGFFYYRNGPKIHQNDILISFFLLPLILYPLVSVETTRWLYPLMPIFFIWCARGIISIDQHFFCKSPRVSNGNSLKSLLSGKYPICIIILFFMLLGMGWKLNKGVKNLVYYPNEHKTMGYWIRDNLPDDSIIMSASPHVSFYSGARLFITPWGTVPEILRYGRYHQVDYLIIDELFSLDTRPLLKELLAEKEYHNGLELIHKITDTNGRKILAYRFIES